MLNRKILKSCRNGKDSPHTPSCDKSVAWKPRPVIRGRHIFVVVFIVFLAACAAPLPPPGTISPVNDRGLFKQTLSDADIIHEGITYLGSPGQSNDYVKARAAFETLLKNYSESKWRRLSETLIHLIDTMQSCREKDLLLGKGEEDKTRLLQENEKLKKDVRYLNDKLKTETSKISEENEQLKKDIQLLKNLEIQLEKRDKRFR
jgi:hypothetical protein